MNQLRIIHTINSETNEERIQFTEDLAADMNDFVAPGFVLESDTIVDIDLPGAFPSEHEFVKRF